MAPAVVNVYEVGVETVQPEATADGAVADSVTIYPVTPTLSEAVNDEIGTMRDDAVEGIVKAVTVGEVVSVMRIVVKVEMIDVSELKITVHEPVPKHPPPLHPVKVEPEEGDAVSVIDVPELMPD